MKIEFNVIPIDSKNISEFELGNMTIKHSDIVITSVKEEAPYQSFMIFPTISDFLDDLMDYKQNLKSRKKIKFKAIDSSFEFELKIKKDVVVLNEKIKVSLYEFLENLYNSSKDLYLNYVNKVDNASGIFNDLKISLENLKKVINNGNGTDGNVTD